jgi:hypothetical protein
LGERHHVEAHRLGGYGTVEDLAVGKSEALYQGQCEMAAAAEPEIVVELPNQPASPKRPSRVTKPSLKVREVMQSLEDTAGASRKLFLTSAYRLHILNRVPYSDR